MAEIDLLKNYPKPKRDLKTRAAKKSPQIRKIARYFGKEFFDGDRMYGYGGFSYNPKYWEFVVPDFVKHYGLKRGMKVLDVGCAKGFMVYDFLRLIPGIEMTGIDISKYAIENAKEEVKKFLRVADARKLPFKDKTFDLVISINTVHNLSLKYCYKAIKEIKRVTKKHAFLTVDAYNTPEEKKRMYDWNLTAKTILTVAGWKKMFTEAWYKGDYYWFTP